MARKRLKTEEAHVGTPLEIDSVQENDVVMFVFRVKVKSKGNIGDNLLLDVVELSTGRPFEIRGNDLVAGGTSADFYSEIVDVGLTKLVEIFAATRGTVYTVVFEKKNGEDRLLRGWTLSTNPSLGQSTVVDADKPKEDCVRTVPHDKIKSLILEGIKYVVK
jgi:hypothetical protein